MVCAAWDTALHRYLDGELADGEVQGLEAHLRGCLACASEALARRELQIAIREAGARFRPSPAFRARMRRAGESRLRLLAIRLLPLAAALVVGAGLAAWVGGPGRRGGGDPALREVIDLHLTQLASTAPLDVVSSDKHTVKPWFEGRIPFAFDLPDLEGTPYELEGGRAVWIGQEGAAQLVVHLRKHRLSVFVLPERPGTPSPLPDVSPRDSTHHLRIDSFERGGLRFAVVGDTSAEDVEALGRLFGGTVR